MIDEVALDILHTLMDRTEIILEHRFLCCDLSAQMRLFGTNSILRYKLRYLSCAEVMTRRGMTIVCHPSRHYDDLEYVQP